MPAVIKADRPILVGESNPYGGDPYYALYPSPQGCSGHRLCCKILGMRRTDYLAAFDRVNVCTGSWDLAAAMATALELLEAGSRLVLFGAKVASAFRLRFRPWQLLGRPRSVLMLPHPSGRCQLWNEAGAIDRARAALLKLCPELAPLVGRADRAGAPAGTP